MTPARFRVLMRWHVLLPAKNISYKEFMEWLFLSVGVFRCLMPFVISYWVVIQKTIVQSKTVRFILPHAKWEVYSEHAVRPVLILESFLNKCWMKFHDTFTDFVSHDVNTHLLFCFAFEWLTEFLFILWGKGARWGITKWAI